MLDVMNPSKTESTKTDAATAATYDAVHSPKKGKRKRSSSGTQMDTDPVTASYHKSQTGIDLISFFLLLIQISSSRLYMNYTRAGNEF